MRVTIAFLLLILLAVTIFALSNTAPVSVMFWQWPVYTGTLASVVIGAGVLGALLTYIPSLVRHTRLARRVRELENQIPVAPETSHDPLYPPKVEYMDKDTFSR